MPKQKLTGDEHLYLQVAEGLEKMIHDEILKIGDKLPSVRMLSEEYGISMGTAFQAYYHLEGKGLIEARPKSGYYVRFNRKRFPALPAVQQQEPIAHTVSVEEMIATVYKSLSPKDLINFSVATPDMSLIPAAKLNKSLVHAFRNSATSCITYEERQGNLELRKQIARLAFNWGGALRDTDIVVTAGCMEALVMSLRTVTQPGDTVAIESPAYFGIFQVIESMGLKAVEIPAHPVTGIDLGYLEKVLKQYAIKACVFIPNFNNPLGSCMPDENKKALVEMITRYKVPLIEDDIYGDLYFGKYRPRTCKTFDTEGWVLHCSSLSKSLAPGYRIGWVIPGRFKDKLARLKFMHNLSGTSITQAAMAHFLGIGRYEYHLKKLRTALHTNYLRYVQGIMQYFPEETRISQPQGGFVLWLELNKKVDAFRLYQEAIKQQVSIAPGRIFSTTDQFSHYLRIGYGSPWDDNEERGIHILGKLVKKLQG